MNALMQSAIVSFKTKEDNDDFQIEYEILPAFDKNKLDPKITEIAQKIAEIDSQSVPAAKSRHGK